MSELKIFLLGPPLIKLCGRNVELQRRKAMALLVYLAATAQRHSRDTLAELLYPRQNRIRATADLRQTLSVLRKAVGKSWFDVTRSGISLRLSPDIWIDLHEFRRLAAIAETLDPHRADAYTEIFVEAVDLYRGEFLSGFYLKDSLAYDDWQLFESERIRREYSKILELLIKLHATRGELTKAIDWSHILLATDPLDEVNYRKLMQLYTFSGQRSKALEQYKKCQSALQRELGETPDTKTVNLAEEIRSGRYLNDSLTNGDKGQMVSEQLTTGSR